MLAGAIVVQRRRGRAGARERRGRRLMDRQMGAAAQRRGVEASPRQDALRRRHMTGLAAVGGAGERQFLLGQAIAVGGARFHQRERLQGLHRRTGKNRPLDLAQRQHATAVGIHHRHGAAVAALDQAATQDFSSRVDEKTLARWGARTETTEKVGAANLKRLVDAGITVAMGTDAGNPLTLHGPSVYAEMEAMQAAGLTPMQVLVASTRGGALAMGREKELGTVEKGKWADLVVLGADPLATVANLRSLRHVVRGGVTRSLEEMKAVVAAAAPTKP